MEIPASCPERIECPIRRQSERMRAALEKAGVKHRLIVKKDKSHGWRGAGPDYEAVADWFAAHLKKQKK